MKKLLAICLIWCVSSGAYAGMGFYVTIENRTKYEATVSNGGNDNWDCGDFCSPVTLKPKETSRFYTEEKTFYLPGDAIQGLNISYGGTTSHAEFWTNKHLNSVNQNVKIKSIDIPLFPLYPLLHNQAVVIVFVYVGVSNPKIDTELKLLAYGRVGTAYVTLILNE